MGNPALASALIGAIKQAGPPAPKPVTPIKLTNPYATPVVAGPKPASGLLGSNTGLLAQQTPSPTGGPVDPTDPKTLGLLSTNQKLQSEISALGTTPSAGHPSLFHRIIDVASRPEYAVADAVKKAQRSAFSGKSVLDQLGAAGSGLAKGFEGKDKTLASDVVQEVRDESHATGKGIFHLTGAGKNTNVTEGEAGPLKAILSRIGLAGLNVVADPTTYIGAGPIKDITSGAADLLKSGKAAEDLLPAAKEITRLGVEPNEAHVTRALLGPQMRGTKFAPTAVSPELATVGHNQVLDLLGRTRAAVDAEAANHATEDLAKQGRKIETVPQPIRVPDFSDPEKVAASFKKLQAERPNHELIRGQAYDVQKPHNLSRTGFIKAVRDARIAGDTKRVNELLRDPSTGRSLLDGGPKNADAGYAYDKHFRLLNRGAKTVDEYNGIKATRDAEIRATDPKIITALSKAKNEATAIHKVAVTRSDVKAAEEYIGRDPAKLRYLPSGSKTGAYAEHLKTLPNRIAEEEKRVGHTLTPEERAPVEDAWWQRQYENYAKFSKIIASKSFDTSSSGRLDWINAAAKEPHVGPKSVERVKRFAGQEHDAINAARRQMLEEVRTTNKGTRLKLNALQESRNEALAEKELRPADFHPTRQDTTESHRVIEQNRTLKQDIAEQAKTNADELYKGIETSVQAAEHIGWAPDTVKRLGLHVGMFGKHATVLKSPEFISNYLKKVVDGDGLINHTLSAFDHAFVSTGKMLPEIAGLKARSEGMVAQLTRRMSMKIQQDFRGTTHAEANDAFNSYIKGVAHPNAELTAKIDAHFQELATLLRNPNNRLLGITLGKVNGMIPKRFELEELPKAKMITAALDHQETTVYMLRRSVEDLLNKGKIHDPAQFLNALNIGKYRAYFAAELKDTIQKSFGVSLKSGKDGAEAPGIAGLRAQGFRPLRAKTEQGVRIPESSELSKYIFDPKIADDLDRMLDLIHDRRSVEELSSFIDRSVLQPWRAATTVYNIPSYMFRNGMQNFYVTWLALRHYGSNIASLGHSYGLSAKWLHEAPPEDLKFSLDPYHTAVHGPVGEDNAQNIRMFRAVYNRGTKLNDIPHEYMTLRDLEGLWLRHGGDSGYFTSQFGNQARAVGGIKQFASRVNNHMANLNKVAENYHRKALFIDAIRHTTKNTADDAAAEAMHTVRKFLFDYHDLTGFEKSSMTRMFPFYKWTRKAFPLMFESMLMQPGKVFGVTKAQYTLAGQQKPNDPWFNNAQTVVPDWLALGTEKVPFMSHGVNQAYGSLPLPFNDLGDQFAGDTNNNPVMGALSGAGSMVNPLFRVPAELLTGHEFYHQLPIPDGAIKYSTIDQFPQFSKLTSFLSSMKAQNQGSTATSGAGAKSSIPFSLLKNSGLAEVSENTPTGQNSQLTASNQKLEAQRKKLLAALAKG